VKITADQLRAARALLDMSQPELSARAKVSVPTVKRCESNKSKAKVAAETRQAIVTALQSAGIEFTNGDAPGVRLVGTKKSRSGR
jgi:DNA-binding transcriptional regulator YiaG